MTATPLLAVRPIDAEGLANGPPSASSVPAELPKVAMWPKVEDAGPTTLPLPEPTAVIVIGFDPVNVMPVPAAKFVVIVAGLVPVSVMPAPAAIVVDGTDTQDVRLPPLSKQAPLLCRNASAGSSAKLSPAGTNGARPVTSLVLSQISRFCAMMSVKT